MSVAIIIMKIIAVRTYIQCTACGRSKVRREREREREKLDREERRVG